MTTASGAAGGEEGVGGARAAAGTGAATADPMRDPERRVATVGEGPGAPSFRREPHPSTYGVPGRPNLKRALRAYVLGHDRGWEAERKLAEAEAEVEARPGERHRRSPEPARADRPRAGVEEARFGVPVARRLDFRRGPDTWRDRLPR